MPGRVHERLRRSTCRHSTSAWRDGWYGECSRRKLALKERTGIDGSLDLSLLQQWGGPDGGSPSLQFLAGLSVRWGLFHSDTLGDGSIELGGSLAAYPTDRDGADMSATLGVISTINDWPVRQSQIDHLTYTQRLPGKRLSLTLGQYPVGDFDGNGYLNDQQQSFVNDIFAQNGSSTYADAGLGVYAELLPGKDIQIAAGYQYPNVSSAAMLSSPDFRQHDRAWFVSGRWTPRSRSLGSGAYSVLYYESPPANRQMSTRGWSFSLEQDLDDSWAVFGRANAASGATGSIRASYALGLALNDPLGRSRADRIGLAIGLSEPANPPVVPAGASSEKVAETYWRWTVVDWLSLTPDVQLIFDPALAPDRNSVWVVSLRTTLTF